MALSVVFALSAGLCYALAAVVQQRVAGKQDDELSLSLRLIWALARRPLWLAGIAVDLGAYCFEAAALGFGSIIVVGPLMASGLLFALPFASFRTGRRVTRREMIPAVMITAGLAVYVAVGAPGGTTSHAAHWAWGVAGGVVIVASATLVLLGRRAREPGRRAACYGLATGIVYSLTAVLTKATVDRLTPQVLPILGHWQLYALLLASAVGLVLNQSAFQAGHIAASLPAISVANPVFASIMGVVLFGEHLGATGAAAWLLCGAAIVVMIIGTLWLARSPLVTEEVAHVPALEV
jgi:drug/metabolite transporter (DMT)-like permease